MALMVDVLNPGSIDPLTKFVSRSFGTLDILVNDAAIQINKTVENTSPDEWYLRFQELRALRGCRGESSGTPLLKTMPLLTASAHFSDSDCSCCVHSTGSRYRSRGRSLIMIHESAFAARRSAFFLIRRHRVTRLRRYQEGDFQSRCGIRNQGTFG